MSGSPPSSWQVFGRSRIDTVAQGVQYWQSQVSPLDRAKAINLMSDDRVSENRDQVFTNVHAAHAGGRVPHDSLNVALKEYFEKRVRIRRRPDYVWHKINGSNIIYSYRNRSASCGVCHDTQLIRTLELTGLRRVFAWAEDKGIDNQVFAGFKLRIGPADPMSPWIEDQVHRQRERFAFAVLEALKQHRKEKGGAFEPVWAAVASEFDQHIRPFSPHRWLELLGVPSRGSVRTPIWIMLLKYAVNDTITLARPTILDTGGPGLSNHFPTPAHLPNWEDGHPSDLGAAPGTPLVREYIHHQIEHPPKHWQDAGSVLEKVSIATTAPLSAARTLHHGKLQRVCGQATITTWMPRPI